MRNDRTLPTSAALAVAVAAVIVGRWAGAQAPPAASPAPDAAEAPAEPPTEAEKLIDEAAKKIEALKSVAADIREKVEMLGQKFAVVGRYMKGTGNRLRMDLKVENLADSSGRMLQVCDGQTLWDYRQVLEARYYLKVGKVPQILEKLQSPDLDPKIREAATAQLGLTGPEALLVGLRKTIKFDQKEEGTLDGRPVWVLRGTWKNRDGLVGPNQQPLPAMMALPAYIPSVASLWIDKETGWPYKVLLVGKPSTSLEDTRPRGPDGRPIGPKMALQKVPPSFVELVYADVKINPTLKPEEFAFEPPPDARVDDNTEQLLTGLDQAIQGAAARKQAEAAQEEASKGPLLPEPLKAPETKK